MEENQGDKKNPLMIGILVVVLFVIYLIWSSYETDRIMDRSYKEADKMMRDAQKEVNDIMRDDDY